MPVRLKTTRALGRPSPPHCPSRSPPWPCRRSQRAHQIRDHKRCRDRSTRIDHASESRLRSRMPEFNGDERLNAAGRDEDRRGSATITTLGGTATTSRVIPLVKHQLMGDTDGASRCIKQPQTPDIGGPGQAGPWRRLCEWRRGRCSCGRSSSARTRRDRDRTLKDGRPVGQQVGRSDLAPTTGCSSRPRGRYHGERAGCRHL